MHDNWLRMLQDHEPPKSSWRPRKSTKSFDRWSVQKKKSQKSHSHWKRSIAWEKLVLPSLVAWGTCTKIRDAPAEKRRESKVQRRSTRTEMLFLWCFSAPYWERIFNSFQSTLHNFKPYYVFNVWNWSLLRSKDKVQNWVRRGSYHLNLCEAHGLNTWGQLPHLMKNDRKYSIMRRTSCSSLSRVLSTRSSCSTLTYVSDNVIAGPWNLFLMCPATIRSENMSEQAQGDLLQTQSRDDEQARGDPLPPELPWG